MQSDVTSSGGTISVAVGTLTGVRGTRFPVLGLDYRNQAPFPFAVLDQCATVFFQDPPLLDQGIDCLAVAFQVIIAARVTFLDGAARITGLLALVRCLGKRQIRSLKGNPLVWRPNRGIPQVPACI